MYKAFENIKKQQPEITLQFVSATPPKLSCIFKCWNNFFRLKNLHPFEVKKKKKKTVRAVNSTWKALILEVASKRTKQPLCMHPARLFLLFLTDHQI